MEKRNLTHAKEEEEQKKALEIAQNFLESGLSVKYKNYKFI
jgi:uncharacterized protein YoaH (UPF0181 family)